MKIIKKIIKWFFRYYWIYNRSYWNDAINTDILSFIQEIELDRTLFAIGHNEVYQKCSLIDFKKTIYAIVTPFLKGLDWDILTFSNVWLVHIIYFVRRLYYIIYAKFYIVHMLKNFFFSFKALIYITGESLVILEIATIFNRFF